MCPPVLIHPAEPAGLLERWGGGDEVEQNLELDFALEIRPWMGIWDILGFSSPAAISAQAQWFKTYWTGSCHGIFQNFLAVPLMY